MIGRLHDFLHQPLDAFDFAAVDWDGDGFCAWGEVGERIEGCYGGVAGCCFAGRDVHFGGAGLEEAMDNVSWFLEGLVRV